MAPLSIGATAAVKNTSSTAPAATAIVPNVSIIKAASGWKLNCADDGLVIIACSPLPCPNRCSTIRICISLSPPGAYPQTVRSGWPSRNNFYLPVRALSKIFKAKFHDGMAKRKLLHKIDPAVWQMAWNVNSQPIGDSEVALKYLAPYIFRVTISNSRIMAVKDRTVTFSYRQKDSNRLRQIALVALEFIRRFLQHVLPTGFMKVRHYGFMSSNCTVSLARLRLLICEALKNMKISLADLASITPKTAMPKPICPTCGGCLLYLFSLIPNRSCRGSN